MKEHKIYGEITDGKTLDQFYSALKLDSVVRGALMPDAHAGYALPIGAVMATTDTVYPSWVGYDIGCGMCAVPLEGIGVIDIEANAQNIFEEIYKDVPVGFDVHENIGPIVDIGWRRLKKMPAYNYISDAVVDLLKTKRTTHGLGTLGGGNHFIEIGSSRDGTPWIVIHSGSRGFGHALATHYMKLASGDGKAREGHFGFKVDSPEGKAYLDDVSFALEYALHNRKTMMLLVLGAIIRATSKDANYAEGLLINRNHNHVEKSNHNGLFIHRKGATHAELDMYGVIPGNMKDGSYIVRGLGNPESLYSSSHGAGRVMSRSQAKKEIDMNKFVDSMKRRGIVSRTDKSVLDEAPDAYKNIHEVMEHQHDLVEIIDHVTPLINIKG